MTRGEWNGVTLAVLAVLLGSLAQCAVHYAHADLQHQDNIYRQVETRNGIRAEHCYVVRGHDMREIDCP